MLNTCVYVYNFRILFLNFCLSSSSIVCLLNYNQEENTDRYNNFGLGKVIRVFTDTMSKIDETIIQ